MHGSSFTEPRSFDAIYDAKRVDPNWEGTLRPSKIPVNCPPVGLDPGCSKPGVTNFSIRQSTLASRASCPPSTARSGPSSRSTSGAERDVGRITARLKQAWGSVGPFLAGQTYSSLHGPRTRFPTSSDFWGPTGTELAVRSASAMDAL